MSKRIVTFASVHHALKAERQLRKVGILIAAINTPRHLSSDCGISLKFDQSEDERVRGFLDTENIAYRGIYDYD